MWEMKSTLVSVVSKVHRMVPKFQEWLFFTQMSVVLSTASMLHRVLMGPRPLG